MQWFLCGQYSTHIPIKQESTPVGCVPTARMSSDWVLSHEADCEQNDWHAPVKTLPPLAIGKHKCHSSYWYSFNGHEVNDFCQAPRSASHLNTTLSQVAQENAIVDSGFSIADANHLGNIWFCRISRESWLGEGMRARADLSSNEHCEKTVMFWNSPVFRFNIQTPSK